MNSGANERQFHNEDTLRIALSRALIPYGIGFLGDLENTGRFKILTKKDANRVFGVGREYINEEYHDIADVKRDGVLWDRRKNMWYREVAKNQSDGMIGELTFNQQEIKNKKSQGVEVQSRIEPVFSDPRIHFGYTVEEAKAKIIDEINCDDVHSEPIIDVCSNEPIGELAYCDTSADEECRASLDDEYDQYFIDKNRDDINSEYYESLDNMAASGHIEHRENHGGKVYLTVPFSEKEEAKKLGAKWDKSNRSWYADVITADLAKWASSTTNDTGADPEILNSSGVGLSGGADVVAFYNKNDRVAYLIADAIPISASRAALRGIVMHEIAVHALTLCRGCEDFAKIVDAFDDMRVRGDKLVIDAFDAAKNANPEMEDGSHKLKEEAIGYYVEKNPTLPLSKLFLGLFRDSLRRIGSDLPAVKQTKIFLWADNISANDVLYMAQKAMRKAPDVLIKNNVARITSKTNPFADPITVAGHSKNELANEHVEHSISKSSVVGISNRLKNIEMAVGAGKNQSGPSL